MQETPLDPLEKKAAMLIFSLPEISAPNVRLIDLWGVERVSELREKLQPEAEEWRFKFEAELGEHTSEAIIAQDIFGDIERAVEKERVKMRYL